MFRPQHVVIFKERNIAEKPKIFTDNFVIRKWEYITLKKIKFANSSR